MTYIRVTGLDQLADLIQDVEIYDDKKIAEIIGELEIAKAYIERELAKLFAHHNEEHFAVELEIIGRNQFIINVYADEVGTFVYYGTSAHPISSDSPMPMYDGEFFARTVSHPGQSPMYDEIDRIVQNAVLVMWMGDAGWAS